MLSLEMNTVRSYNDIPFSDHFVEYKLLNNSGWRVQETFVAGASSSLPGLLYLEISETVNFWEESLIPPRWSLIFWLQWYLSTVGLFNSSDMNCAFILEALNATQIYSYWKKPQAIDIAFCLSICFIRRFSIDVLWMKLATKLFPQKMFWDFFWREGGGGKVLCT